MTLQPIIAGLALAVPLAFAPAVAHGETALKLSNAEQQFLQEVAQEDQSEINLANLALQKSPNALVKNYARKILSADPQMESGAMTIAQQGHEKIAETPTATEHDEYSKLSHLSGDSFDHEYLRYEANRQKQDLDMVQHEVQTANDQQVKTFAQKEETPIQQVSTSAQQLAASMGGKGTPT
jgi:putative membrane protein